MTKVKEVNLELGYPTVDEALRAMVNQISTHKRQAGKAIILVHGYGSSGIGGKIRIAVRTKLKEPSMSGIVRKSCGGEEWTHAKKEMLDLCGQLKDYELRIAGNPGLTVVVLK